MRFGLFDVPDGVVNDIPCVAPGLKLQNRIRMVQRMKCCTV